MLAMLMALQAIALPDAQAGRGAKTARSAKTAKSVVKIKKQRVLRSPRHRPTTRLTAQTLRHARKVAPGKSLKATPPRLAKKTLAPARRNQRVKAKVPRARVVKTSKVKAFGKAVKSKVAKLKNKPLVRKLGKRITRMAAATTRRLDSWQARAPPWLAKSIKAVRTYSLPAIAAYSLTRLKNDPKFLGSYFVANSIVSYGVLPAAVSFGLNPVTSAVLNALSTPVTLGVLILRDRQLKRKAGQEVTLAQSAKAVLHEFRDFAKKRLVNTSTRAQALAMK
jgi:hypothetical protein